MLREDDRVCDVCGDGIARGIPYRVGTLTPHPAAELLDTDEPELVPTWTQLPDGTVQLEICLECFALMDDPVGLAEVHEEVTRVLH